LELPVVEFRIWKGTLKSLQQRIYQSFCIIIIIIIIIINAIVITIIIIIIIVVVDVVVVVYFSTKYREHSLNDLAIFCGLLVNLPTIFKTYISSLTQDVS
jgi:uncharacterized membrane protein